MTQTGLSTNKQVMFTNVDPKFKKEVNAVFSDASASIKNLNEQSAAMKYLMEDNLNQKQKYAVYQYKRASYKIDQSLNYLLSLIAQIDDGPSSDEYMEKFKTADGKTVVRKYQF